MGLVLRLDAGCLILFACLAKMVDPTSSGLKGNQQQVRALLNQAPLFWNTCLGALQTASIIALGRVFDQSSEHNIDRVLGIAQKNLGIFSKSALGLRKQGNGPHAARVAG